MSATPTVRTVEFRDGAGQSGLVLRADGRLSLIADGRGFSLQLSSAQLRELGHRCAAIAALLAEKERSPDGALVNLLAEGHG